MLVAVALTAELVTEAGLGVVAPSPLQISQLREAVRQGEEEKDFDLYQAQPL